jgi:hypothetical protein
MNDVNQSKNEIICKQLFHDFRGILSWKWDDWIGTFLAEFDTDREKDIRTILEKHLPISWDDSSINTAPQIVKALDEHLGGLRSMQYLFSSDPSNEVFVFCAWWPWGNGTTISLRVAPFNGSLSNPEEDKLIEQLKVSAGI